MIKAVCGMIIKRIGVAAGIKMFGKRIILQHGLMIRVYRWLQVNHFDDFFESYSYDILRETVY